MQNEINIQESSLNQKSYNTMSVMLCTGATFVKSHTRPDILSLISVTLSHINNVIIVPSN